MSRSRASAKAAGAKFERVVADYLAAHVDDRIDRRVKTGSLDKGDIGGVRFRQFHLHNPDFGQHLPTGKVVIEAKDCAAVSLGTWMNEAEIERINDNADVAIVAHKRRGKGEAGDQWVTMTLRDLATLLSGSRPADG